MEGTMTIAEVMTRNVQTVPATMRAPQAWELMRCRRIHHLVVTDGSKVTGVLSDRDGDGPGGAILRADSTVADLVSSEVVTIEPTEPVRKAARLMRRRSLSCLPVTKGTRLVGVLTVSDLLDVLARGVEGRRGARRRTR
jgi:CBS domain-containing protein